MIIEDNTTWGEWWDEFKLAAAKRQLPVAASHEYAFYYMEGYSPEIAASEEASYGD